MKELAKQDLLHVCGGLHIKKLHFNVFQALFTVVGAGILGGPVGAGVAIGAVIATQGAIAFQINILGADECLSLSAGEFSEAYQNIYLKGYRNLHQMAIDEYGNKIDPQGNRVNQ